jgi:hypothetical protein
MGHTSDETMGCYTSGLVGNDSQSMVRGREQKQDLLDENSLMMAKRNLLAPQPPGSQLIHQSLRPVREKVANITGRLFSQRDGACDRTQPGLVPTNGLFGHECLLAPLRAQRKAVVFAPMRQEAVGLPGCRGFDGPIAVVSETGADAR